MRNRLFIPLALLTASALLGQEAQPEDQIMARMFRLIVGYVSWPSPGDGPLRIAILGGNALRDNFDDAFDQGTVGGRKVVLRYLSAASFVYESQEFDVVFIDRAEEERIPSILAKIKGKSVLTLGRGEDLAHRRLMVNFYREGLHIRFEINVGKMKESGLNINSGVLRIGKPKGNPS